MLTKRIIPCLDVNNGRVVKGTKFTDIRDVDDPVVLAAFYAQAGADELVFYDITASSEQRDIFLDIVKKTADTIDIPFTIGGGIRSLEDFDRLMKAGADKVSINSAAVNDPQLIKEAALRYGSQCVVLSMDVKKNTEERWDVYVKGGRENTGMDAIAWAKQGVALGAGEIVLNSIDTDGVKNGYALDITREISDSVRVPVIASGGAGSMEHFYDVLTVGKADAALGASVFHFGEIQINELKEYLKDKGVEVRL
jgi:imidazole glycerol-phosphate synthase subunit HisF